MLAGVAFEAHMISLHLETCFQNIVEGKPSPSLTFTPPQNICDGRARFGVSFLPRGAYRPRFVPH